MNTTHWPQVTRTLLTCLPLRRHLSQPACDEAYKSIQLSLLGRTTEEADFTCESLDPGHRSK
jgi:hypothetical protein